MSNIKNFVFSNYHLRPPHSWCGKYWLEMIQNHPHLCLMISNLNLLHQYSSNYINKESKIKLKELEDLLKESQIKLQNYENNNNKKTQEDIISIKVLNEKIKTTEKLIYNIKKPKAIIRACLYAHNQIRSVPLSDQILSKCYINYIEELNQYSLSSSSCFDLSLVKSTFQN